MATAASSLMTAEEFWEFVQRPENAGRRFELVRGETVEMPTPGKFHGFVAASIGTLLMIYARTNGRGYACTNDSGVLIGREPDTVRGPDICFYDDHQTLETMDRGYSTTLPRLVAEVLSPSDSFPRTLRKAEQYVRAGVAAVWIVDPESRTVTVVRLDEMPKVVDETEELTGEDVLPDFRCRVSELFTLPGT